MAKGILVEIPLSRIVPDPNQPRRTFIEASIRELAENIRQNGLAQPLTVRPHPEDPALDMLVDGERRYQAFLLLGEPEKPVPCYLLEGISDPFERQIIANLHREDLNPIDRAEAFQKLRGRGRTTEQICELTGASVPTIYNALRLLTLPPEIQQLVRDDKLAQRWALNLAQFSRTPRGELIRLAYDLVHGEGEVKVQEALFEQGGGYHDRLRRTKDPLSPERLLAKVLELGWRSRAAIRATRAFLTLSEADRVKVWGPLGGRAKTNLSSFFEALERTSRAFLEAMKQWDGESPSEPTPRQTERILTAPPLKPAAPPQRTTAPPAPPVRSEEATISPPAVSRTLADQSTFRAVGRRVFPDTERPPLPVPVVVGPSRKAEAVPPRISSSDGSGDGRGQVAQQSVPPPQKREREPLVIAGGQRLNAPFSQKPVGLIRNCAFVLRLMVVNPKRHERVNLSKLRLVQTTAFSRDVIEGVALGALRLVQKCWDEDPKLYNGPARNLLDIVSQMKTDFGETFPKAMNVIWLEDQSPDPIDLAKL